MSMLVTSVSSETLPARLTTVFTHVIPPCTVILGPLSMANIRKGRWLWILALFSPEVLRIFNMQVELNECWGPRIEGWAIFVIHLVIGLVRISTRRILWNRS